MISMLFIFSMSHFEHIKKIRTLTEQYQCAKGPDPKRKHMEELWIQRSDAEVPENGTRRQLKS